MIKYIINNVITYRVSNVNDALKLREELSNSEYGELNSFSYIEKEIKAKGEVVETYVLCKAKMIFNAEKEPESSVDIFYGYEENDHE